MSEQILNLKGADLTETKLASLGKVLVDFWAPWCGYCLRLGPAVAQVAAEEDGRLAVGKLNIDDAPELAARYGISSIPTLILFKNGQACPPVVGPSGKGGIRAYLSEQGL